MFSCVTVERAIASDDRGLVVSPPVCLPPMLRVRTVPKGLWDRGIASPIVAAQEGQAAKPSKFHV